MAELKTRRTTKSVDEFLKTVGDEKRRRECRSLLRIMKQATRAEPTMWGSSIVGFGSYHYKYASGREGDWFLTGFSPRKQALTLYVMDGFAQYHALLRRLGKHKTGKSCLYIKNLDDVDMGVLGQLIARSVEHVARSNA